MATADSVKSKIQGLIDQSNATTGNTDADLTTAVNSLIAGFGAGGGGGIGAVKFIDVDITVEASTTTAVTYTVDGLAFVSSVESPTKWNAFNRNDMYIAFVTPKELTDAPTTTTFTGGMCVFNGNTNYTPTLSYLAEKNGEVYSNSLGVRVKSITCSSIEGGKIVGYLTVTVQHGSSGFEVLAGTYNVQMWYLTHWAGGKAS